MDEIILKMPMSENGITQLKEFKCYLPEGKIIIDKDEYETLKKNQEYKKELSKLKKKLKKIKNLLSLIGI